MPERNPPPIQPPEHDAPAGGEDWARPLIERQLQLLGRLAEVGLEVALLVERQAKDAGPEVDARDLAMAYARAARAVRMTIALQSKLIEDLKAREAADAEADVEADAAGPDEEEMHKVRVGRVVLRVIESEHDDDDEIDRLIHKAEGLLDDEDIYDDILDHPIGELVARICRDLGLSPDWTRLAEEAWARKEIAQGPQGSPFAEWMGDERDLSRSRERGTAGTAVERAFSRNTS